MHGEEKTLNGILEDRDGCEIMVNSSDYDTTTAAGTAEWFQDCLESMIGESWFRHEYPIAYEHSRKLCSAMRTVAKVERIKDPK